MSRPRARAFTPDSLPRPPPQWPAPAFAARARRKMGRPQAGPPGHASRSAINLSLRPPPTQHPQPRRRRGDSVRVRGVRVIGEAAQPGGKLPPPPSPPPAHPPSRIGARFKSECPACPALVCPDVCFRPCVIYTGIYFQTMSACNWANLKINEVLGCELQLMGCSECGVVW